MKPYSLFLIVVLPLLLIGSASPGAGKALSAGSPVGVCDSVSKSPFVGEMLVFNVSISGGGSTATVTANDSFTVSFEYFIQVCQQPLLKNYCQVVVGFGSLPAPQSCVFQARVGCPGQNGTLSFRMKAPSYPSEYIIAIDIQQDYDEEPCPTVWPRGTPVPDQYIGCVNVTAANLAVLTTGSASAITPTSATLHGTVHPSGASTIVRFAYGQVSGVYTDSVIAAESPVAGDSTIAVSASISGLTANTGYFFRMTGENENGYALGGEQTFYTGPRFSLGEPVHSFGHLPLNGSRTDSITVFNAGDLNLQITSVVALSGQYSASPLTATITPGGSKKFAVTFSPPAYGPYNSGIVFVHNGASTPDTQLVRGDVPIGGVITGWNIVSVPLTAPDPRKIVVFPDAISNAFEFSSGYTPRDTLVNGRGYWLKFPATDSLVVAGGVRSSELVTVVGGWNMIGGPTFPVPLDSIVSTPPGIIAGNFFEYSAGYSPVTVLSPGKGFWVKTSQGGTLHLKGAASVPSPGSAWRRSDPEGATTSLLFTDARGSRQELHVGIPTSDRLGHVELPPPPPDGAFDVRFDGDVYAAVLPDGHGGGLGVRMRGASFPVTISWSGEGGGGVIDAGGLTNQLSVPGQIVLQDSVPIIVRGAREALMSGGRMAAAGLVGNHPNPFNPTTVVSFAMPAPGPVRLTVFNALGEQVSVLLDGVRGAGEHEVVFDAAGLPGGVYFCRMQGAGRPSTLKLLLVK